MKQSTLKIMEGPASGVGFGCLCLVGGGIVLFVLFTLCFHVSPYLDCFALPDRHILQKPPKAQETWFVADGWCMTWDDATISKL